MQMGLVGPGKMGGNMRERLRQAGHTVIGLDTDPELSDAARLTGMVEQIDSTPGSCGSWCRTRWWTP